MFGRETVADGAVVHDLRTVGDRSMTYNARSIVWIVVYLLFVLLPLFALLAGSLPPTRGFWTEFSAALGYSGLAIMGLQFGLTARFKYVTEPWGEDVIYHFHRQISLFAVALVLAHLLIMLVAHPELLALPRGGELPWGAVRFYVRARSAHLGGDGAVARQIAYFL
jgi:predicted ferric reductase